ncbi:acyl-CoA dehydrogenase family protein [Parasphingorhabdus pacifica]
MDSELVELRHQVRQLCARWREQGRYQPRPDAWLRSFDLDFSRALAERGWLGMTWPEEVGGGERSNLARLVVTEELLRAGAPVAAHWIGDRQIGPSILRHGTPELRHEILPGIAAGEYVFCLGMSEPEAGSDLAAVRTTASRAEGGWVINGRKIWTSHAHHATHAYVLARTERTDSKHEGLTEFVVDMSTSGISTSPIVDMAGSHHFNEMVFEGAFVPDHRVIGTVGNGWRQVTEQLAYERGGPERVLSTYPVLKLLLAQSRGHPDDGAAAEIGELVARLGTLRRLCVEIAEALDDGQAPVRAAATLKYLGTAFERDVLERARDVADSTATDSVLGEAILASPGFGIRGGSSEVLLSVLAKQEAR